VQRVPYAASAGVVTVVDRPTVAERKARRRTARGERLFTGGVLALTRDIAAEIEALYQRVIKAGQKSLATAERELGLDPGALGDADSPTASFTDRICFRVWLRALLDLGRRPPPELQNTDGDPLLLARTQLQVAPGAVTGVSRRLDQLAGWNRESDDEPRWVWLSERKAQSATARGMARLEAGALVIETNSRRRMEQALQELQASLGPLVTAAPTSYEDPVRAMPDRAGRPGGGAPPDEPAPAFEKEIENHELRQAAESGTPPYDLRWMWQELGIEGER